MPKIDFRTKLYMTAVTGLICINGNLQYRLPSVSLVICLFPFVLLLWHGKLKFVFLKKKEDENAKRCFEIFLQGGISVLIVWFLSVKLPYKNIGLLSAFIFLLNGILIRMLPGFMMGYYALFTSSMSDIVFSLGKMKLPEFIIIPLSLMFRFFYSIKEDYSQIKEAIKMHGISFRNNYKNPMRLIEYRIVPLLMCATRCADDVAVSAMTRGMVIGKKRSSISDAKLRLVDYILLGLYTFFLVLFFKFL